MFRTGRNRLPYIAVLFAGLLNAALAQPARAATCNGFVQIYYVSGPSSAAMVGDTIRVRLTLFSSSITGGISNVLQMDRVRFDLDCSVDAALGLPCTDDGSVLRYQGNITTNQCKDSGGNPV